MIEHIQQLQASVLHDCHQFIRAKEIAALRANNMLWQQSSKERQEYNHFSPTNLETVLSRVPNYIRCVQQCVEKWIGYHFHFPILWMQAEEYHAHYRLANKDEGVAWKRLKNV